jgi:D-3-phosphoglycerate dehydrogenase / 2-oxoglutarate reductase
MRGLAWDVVEPPAGALPEGAEFTADLGRALAGADVVTIHLPLTPDTHHLVGARELAQVPAGAILVNVGRGGVVDEVALAAAISDGRIAAAGVDVFEQEPPSADNPLLALGDRVIVSPHSGGLSDAASRAIGETIAADILRVFDGLAPQHPAAVPRLAEAVAAEEPPR